jgi:hypothetical protein
LSTWQEFEAGAAALAPVGRKLLGSSALLATVRDGDLPRLHPVDVGVVNGRLYTFIFGRSAKCADLEQDGRFALHARIDPAAPDEFSIRGRAQVVEDAGIRTSVAAGWSFDVDESYRLFELDLQAAILGERSADEWPPRYSSWAAGT